VKRTAVARGRADGLPTTEECVPTPNDELLMLFDDPLDSSYVASIVVSDESWSDGEQPELGVPIGGLDVDVWRLADPLVFVREEVEPVWPDSKDGRHGVHHMKSADRLDGNGIVTLAASPGPTCGSTVVGTQRDRDAQ